MRMIVGLASQLATQLANPAVDTSSSCCHAGFKISIFDEVGYQITPVSECNFSLFNDNLTTIIHLKRVTRIHESAALLLYRLKFSQCIVVNPHKHVTAAGNFSLLCCCCFLFIQEVMVDFEAHTISHGDFNGIKKLLQQVWDNVYTQRALYQEHHTIGQARASLCSQNSLNYFWQGFWKHPC